MTLSKLSFRNMQRSVKDYAIYFFTLVIGVAIFYVFNAIGGQAAMMQVSSSRNDIVELLNTTIFGVSILVAIILAFLIVYASRFLMKRRNKEFALYMLLGMSKGKISAMLLTETVFIGIGSLLVGLAVGIGLSQLMSALVVNLFEADMSAYRLSISGKALLMTIIFFAVMYLIVMLFNSASVSKMKLIDLINSGKKSEKVRLKNPVLCVLIFIASALCLGDVYYQVIWNYGQHSQMKIIFFIALASLATFFVFWSVSGLLLRVVMSVKKSYFKGLNAFTFRQISSKVNTMVFAMTIICLLLFVTICSLTAAFSIRNSLNTNLKNLCPADAEVEMYEAADLEKIYADCGYDIKDGFKEYVNFNTYTDPSLTLEKSLGEHVYEIQSNFKFLDFGVKEEIIKLSDYNDLMSLYGKERQELSEDEYILICDYSFMKEIRDKAMAEGSEITVFGRELKSKYNECLDGFISIGAQHLNIGVYIVPDDVVSEDNINKNYFIGNYAGESKADIEKAEQMQRERKEAVYEYADAANIFLTFNSKADIYEAATGLGAIVAFLGLYIGLVFLIACGAILALKELSESVDSKSRYEMLRKIGVEEREINRSLFRQTGIFFLIPLLLAIVHSVFGMKFTIQVLETLGTDGMWKSIIITAIIILLIYGGYFLITFFNSKRIIKG